MFYTSKIRTFQQRGDLVHKLESFCSNHRQMHIIGFASFRCCKTSTKIVHEKHDVNLPLPSSLLVPGWQVGPEGPHLERVGGGGGPRIGPTGSPEGPLEPERWLPAFLLQSAEPGFRPSPATPQREADSLRPQSSPGRVQPGILLGGGGVTFICLGGAL